MSESGSELSKNHLCKRRNTGIEDETTSKRQKTSPNPYTPTADLPFLEHGLQLEGIDIGFERLVDYEPGGHHPVHLGDLIGRYRVIHKLGNGGFANVWLCRDLEAEGFKYMAVKILMADESGDECVELKITELLKSAGSEEAHICLPLDTFRVEGPNGGHVCFVYPALGPRASRIHAEFPDPDGTLRKIARQTVQAMHTCMSTRVSGLDGLSEKQVIEALGEPQLNRVLKIWETEELYDLPTAPQYLVRPIEFSKFGTRFVTDDACVIDNGESFPTFTPFEDLGIPQSYENVSPWVVQDPRSFQETLQVGLWYTHEDDPVIHRAILNEEIEVFADLLGRMLEHQPEERIGLKEVLEHKWFEM